MGRNDVDAWSTNLRSTHMLGRLGSTEYQRAAASDKSLLSRRPIQSKSESQLVDKSALSRVNRMRMNSTSPMQASIDRSYKSNAYVRDSMMKSDHLRVNCIDVNFGAALRPV